MAELFALLLIGSLTLPFAIGLVGAIYYNISGTQAAPGLILIVWIICTLLFWLSILP
ncbi:MAG TPA: hypothetical protein VFZ66_11755 [Herpetosiphonaceae bacterium]